VPDRAETIPAEPDPANTGVGIEPPLFQWLPRHDPSIAKV